MQDAFKNVRMLRFFFSLYRGIWECKFAYQSDGSGTFYGSYWHGILADKCTDRGHIGSPRDKFCRPFLESSPTFSFQMDQLANPNASRCLWFQSEPKQAICINSCFHNDSIYRMAKDITLKGEQENENVCALILNLSPAVYFSRLSNQMCSKRLIRPRPLERGITFPLLVFNKHSPVKMSPKWGTRLQENTVVLSRGYYTSEHFELGNRGEKSNRLAAIF